MPQVEVSRRELYIPHVAAIADEPDEHVIHAVASTDRLDRHGTRILPGGMKAIEGPLPLLWSHQVDKPAGRITAVSTYPDRIEIEAEVSDEEIWRMILDGRVSGISIGFIELSSHGDNPRTVDRFEVVEISLVTAPSNVDAKIISARSVPETITMSEDHVALPAVVTRAAEPAIPSAPRLVSSRPLGGPHVKRAVAPYSLSKVIRSVIGDAPLDGIEAEVGQELQRRTAGEPGHGGVRVPSAIFQKSRHSRSVWETRQTDTSTGSAEALTRPETYLGELLDDIAAATRWGSILPSLNILRVTSPQEVVSVPKRDGILTAGMSGKDAIAPDSGALSFDEDRLSPKYGYAFTSIKRSALRYTNPQVEQLAITDIGEALDVLVDEQCLFGSGLTVNVKGLLTAPARTLDLEGAPASSADVVLLKNAFMETWKIDDEGTLRWLLSHRSHDALALTSLKQLGEDSAGEWFRGVVPSSTIEGMLFGIPEIKSGKVLPTTAGPPATYSIHLIRPDMLLAVFFGSGSIDLILDPFTSSRSGQINLVAFLDFNAVSRDPESHVALTNVSSVPPQGAAPARGISDPPPPPPPTGPAPDPPAPHAAARRPGAHPEGYGQRNPAG